MPPGIGYPTTARSGSRQGMRQQQSQSQQSSPFSGFELRPGAQIEMGPGVNFSTLRDFSNQQPNGGDFLFSANPETGMFTARERSQAPRPQPQQQNPFASILGLTGLVPQQPQFDMAGLFQLLGLSMPPDLTQPPQVPLSLNDLLGGF